MATRRRHRTSGRVTSAEQHLVPGRRAPLASRERASVRVRVWAADGRPVRVERTARRRGRRCSSRCRLAGRAGQPAGLGRGPSTPSGRRPACGASSRWHGRSSRARLYTTAHGLYEAEINGDRVGDDALSPGLDRYPHRLRYHTYDVTAHPAHRAERHRRLARRRLVPRPHRLQRRQPQHLRQPTSPARPARDAPRRRHRHRHRHRHHLARGLRPDPRQRASTTARRYDARLADRGWSAPGFDDSGWTAVEPRATATSGDAGRRRPARRCAAPRNCARSRSRRRADGTAPARLRPEPRRSAAHPRQRPGRDPVDAAPRRGAGGRRAGYPPAAQAPAPPTSTCCAAAAIETWEPRFTIHGFRYAEVERLARRARPPIDVVARVYHTDMRAHRLVRRSQRPAGRTDCTRTCVWSMRGNFVDIPTDCPQRDERLGWTGDIQVFAPTAAFLYDAPALLDSWLRDVGARAAARRHRALVRTGGSRRRSLDPDPPRRGLGRRRSS